jgi:hypothetical protein
MPDSLNRWWEQLGVTQWFEAQGQLPRWLLAAVPLVVLVIVLRLARALLSRRARQFGEKQKLLCI